MLPRLSRSLDCTGDYYDLLIAAMEHDAVEFGIPQFEIMTDAALFDTLMAQPDRIDAEESEAVKDGDGASERIEEDAPSKLEEGLQRMFHRILRHKRDKDAPEDEETPNDAPPEEASRSEASR